MRHPHTTILYDNDDDSTDEVVLPFTFRWLAKHSVTVVRVSTNGNINIDKDDNPSRDELCCDASPIVLGSSWPHSFFANGDVSVNSARLSDHIRVTDQ
jgi:hypothetical protein